ncbi:MAG: class II aldolase/adducin family protein, partial [Elsteraceae bacterium]
VLHTHTKAGVAVSCLEEGLLPLNQFSLQFHNRLAYHDYQGIALDVAERASLVADLGDKWSMILRNHGLLTCGKTVAAAFNRMFYLNQSCEVQIAAQSAGKLRLPSPEVMEHTAKQFERDTDIYDLEWSALVRLLDEVNPGYDQ